MTIQEKRIHVLGGPRFDRATLRSPQHRVQSLTSSVKRCLGLRNEIHSGTCRQVRWNSLHLRTCAGIQPVSRQYLRAACSLSSPGIDLVEHLLLVIATKLTDRAILLYYKLRKAKAESGIVIDRCTTYLQAGSATWGTRSWKSSNSAITQSNPSSWGSTWGQDWCSTSSFCT